MRDFSSDQIFEAVKNSGGIISQIAKKLNCDWHTAKTAIESTAEQRRAFDTETQAVLDMAESQIIKASKDGDIATCKWYLLTKGKARGYSANVEVQSNVTVTSSYSLLTREQRLKRIAELESIRSVTNGRD